MENSTVQYAPFVQRIGYDTTDVRMSVRIVHGVLSQTKTYSLCEHKEKRKLMQCCGSFSILTTSLTKT